MRSSSPPDIALNKTAYSSSTYYGMYGPENAVDGDTSTITKPGGSYAIFHSGDTDTRPWLSIDLGAVYNISSIVIYNRLDCCGDRLEGAEVRVGNVSIKSTADTGKIPQNPLVWKQDSPIDTGGIYTIIIPSSSPAIGRWLTLQNFNSKGRR
ncbi:hypothetical protein PLESTM_001161300 [Pleodorina starrii]|nr:hypothetical protein PLESTM_001161300 [Pleodorina starrii]